VIDLADLPIEMDYELTVDDHVEAALHHHESSPSARRFRRGALLGGSGLILGTALLGGGALTAIPLATLGVFVVFTKALLPRIQREQLVALFREGRNRGFVGRQRIVLSKLNVTAINEVQETKTRWSGVERIVVSEHLIHIYTNSVRAHIVPKRAFPSEAAFLQFLGIARELHAAASLSENAQPQLPQR